MSVSICEIASSASTLSSGFCKHISKAPTIEYHSIHMLNALERNDKWLSKEKNTFQKVSYGSIGDDSPKWDTTFNNISFNNKYKKSIKKPRNTNYGNNRMKTKTHLSHTLHKSMSQSRKYKLSGMLWQYQKSHMIITEDLILKRTWWWH